MSIFDDAKRSISKGLIERYFNAEKAYWKNGEYWTLNPLRSDKKIGSFSISENGFYNDFATGESGGFIDLISQHFNLSKKEAAEKIINDSGGFISKDKKPAKKKKKPVYEAQKITKEIALNIRENLVNKANSLCKDKSGNQYEIVKFYDYREYETNNVLFYIARYECKELKNKGEKYKKFHPFSLDKNGKINIKLPENFKPFPLYQINKIIGNDLPVIIVEGEKCAEVETDDFILVTFSGGANNIQNFDFSPLKKRDVYIWPDNDKQVYKEDHKKAGELLPKNEQPGYKAALEIQKYLPQAIILNVDILEKPDKWDIADAADEGLNIKNIVENMLQNTKDIPPIDPYYAYKKFICELYGSENLVQIDGVMWQYLKDKHFWRQIKKENLSVDFQLWMEKSGAVEILDSMEKSKHSYKSQACSFINTHGTSYYEDNFFKYSAISPFIHFKNGAIELNEHGFKFYSRENNSDDFFRSLYPVNCFNYSYDEKNQGKIDFKNIEKYAPLFCYFIKSIIPEEIKNDPKEIKKTFIFVFQIIAYCMSPVKPNEHFFGLYGDQGSAKSSFFRLISLFIGKDFIVNRSFEDFKNNRFATNDLWGSKIYVDEDIAENQPLPDDFIKRNCGNQEISIEAKHQNTIKGVSISITMFFISNYEFKATGIEGIDRRAIIIPFENQLPESKRDQFIMQRICGFKEHDNKTPERKKDIFDERPYILNMVLDSWIEFIENNNNFTIPDWIRKSSNKMKTSMTSIGSFFNSIIENEIENINIGEIISKTECYEVYKEWCSEENRRPKGRNKFYEDFSRIKNDNYYIEQSRSSTIGNVFKIVSKKVNDDDLAKLLGFGGEQE